MNLVRFCLQSSLSLTTIGITTCFINAPSQAFELIFSSPGVISGIKGVPFTLPSTGVSGNYNVLLERGTVNDVYGTPPQFDVFTEEDALSAMNSSAQGINFYLANVSDDLSFESLGTDVFYIAYPPSGDNTPVISSRIIRPEPGPSFIDVDMLLLPSNESVVYARLIPVPEPTSSLGILSFGLLGTGVILKRKLKFSKFTD